MLELREITRDNLFDCLELATDSSQKGYVCMIDLSLAEAWSRRPYSYAKAIYNGDLLIGFVYFEIEDDWCEIMDFMIDKSYQGRGFGRQAIQICLAYLKYKHDAEEVNLYVGHENDKARGFLKSLGFRETHKGEKVVHMEIKI